MEYTRVPRSGLRPLNVGRGGVRRVRAQERTEDALKQIDVVAELVEQIFAIDAQRHARRAATLHRRPAASPTSDSNTPSVLLGPTVTAETPPCGDSSDSSPVSTT